MSDPTDAPFHLLFVCTGNTCRSPMAEVIARHRVAELGWTQIEVRSAGVGAYEGSVASGGAVRTAASHGLDLSEHSATLLTHEEVAAADLILTMSTSHLMRVMDLGGGDRATLLTSFAASDEGGLQARGVPDPIGGSDEEYEETFTLLDETIQRVLQRLEEEASA